MRAVHPDEGGSERDADVEGVGETVRRFRSLGQQAQRGLEQLHGFSIRRLRYRLCPCLLQVPHRLCAQPCPRRMMREHLDDLAQPVGMQPLDRLHDGGVKGAPPILQQAAISHVVGERVLERVLEIGEQTRFVEELRRLQLGEGTLQIVAAHVGDCLQQHDRHVLAHHRRGLQQALVLGR